jgi:hypothetical protein
VKAVLDAGALICLDGGGREMLVRLRLLQQEHIPVHTSAGAVAQVWRSGQRQVNLARVLPGLDVAPIDQRVAQAIGELLGASKTKDLLDAHVAMLAEPGCRVFTSDDADVKALLKARRVKAEVVHV